MRRPTLILFLNTAWIAVWLLGSMNASAVTVTDLQARLAKGEKLTLIDVRDTAQFISDHIPGAINVPAALCPQKHLPPIGKVIVYDAGLGFAQPTDAATALAAKPGITVEILEGGFAAWESAQAGTTRGLGMKSEKLNYISYADLKAANPDEVLLVDLRQTPKTNTTAKAAHVADVSVVQLTDLNTEFPGLRQTTSPFQEKNTSHIASQTGSGTPPLLVLIDNGDGKAQTMAQTLKAHGVKRYVILAGGELILTRHGQRGLERNSPGTRLSQTISASGGTTK